MERPQSRLDKRENKTQWVIKRPPIFQGVDIRTNESIEDFTKLCIAFIASGANVKRVLDINHHTLEYIYSIAFSFYQEAKYEKSIPLFNLLTLLDYESSKYLFALAATYQMIGHLQTAVNYYEIAFIIDPDDPFPLFRLAECYLKLEEKDKSMALFEKVIEIAGYQSKYAELRERSELILNELKF